MENKIRKTLEKFEPFAALSEEDKQFIAKLTADAAEEQIKSATDHNRWMELYTHEQTVQEKQK